MKNLTDLLNEQSLEAKEKMHNVHNVHDCSNMDNDVIIQLFRTAKIMHYEPGVPLEEQFYGGITNNIKRNLSRHKIESYLKCVKVDSFETAKEIERRLHDDLRIFIGIDGAESAGQGGKEESDSKGSETRYVYLAKRNTPGFED